MDLDDTLVALADDTRRTILKRLAAGDARVPELAPPSATSSTPASKPTRIRERAGRGRRRAAGRDHSLSLDPAPLDAAAAGRQRGRAAGPPRLDKLEAALR